MERQELPTVLEVCFCSHCVELRRQQERHAQAMKEPIPVETPDK